MSDNTTSRAEYTSEKKVWSPVSASQAFPPPESKLPEGMYFLAIEELSGAWIEGVWEEADGGTTEEWDEVGVDSNGAEYVKTITKHIPRTRRYVLKRFTETGFAENAYAGSFSGPRKYKN